MTSQSASSAEVVKVFSSWLEAINARLGTALALDEDSRFCLQMDEEVLVGVELAPGEGVYRIYSPLMALRERSEIPVLAQALSLNLYQKATVGGVIGLDAGAGMLIYSVTQELGSASPDLLATQLDRMPSIVAALRGLLLEARDPDVRLTEAERLLVDEDESYERSASMDEARPAGPFVSLA